MKMLISRRSIRVRVLLVSTLLIGCAHHSGSRASNCHIGNAFGRIGRPTNAVANAIEDARCDQLEAMERAEAREDARIERDRREARHRENDAQLARIRLLPKAPEINATLAEAKAICEQERGVFMFSAPIFKCTVGGPIVFAGSTEGERVVRTDVYYEGGEIGESRRNVEKVLGPVEGEQLTPDGFRAFIWKGGSIVLAMYPRGVRLSTAAGNEGLR